VVLVVLGQSNAASTNEADGFIPRDGVDNLNPADGLIYRARDPLLGASHGTPPMTASFATVLGDLLLKQGLAERVVLLDIAIGGSTIAAWAIGPLNYRIAQAGRCLRALRLRPTFILQHIGESDASEPPSASLGQKFLRFQRLVVRDFRRHGMNCPYFIAGVARMVDFNLPESQALIRGAQRAACDPASRVFPGPDTDVLGKEFRADVVHFNRKGRWAHAEMWVDVLRPHLKSRQS
jgi:lysophospholipase L1-like esterase